MPRTHKDTDKQKALRHQGTLNPRPQDVRHPLFRDGDFFDPDDMIQVKYEMLRQVHVDNLSISQAPTSLGFPGRRSTRPAPASSRLAYRGWRR